MLQSTDVLGRPLTSRNRPGARKGQHPPNYGRTFPAEVLERPELDRLLEAAENNGYCPIVGQRNRTLLIVLWRSGLRLAEALDLEIRDLDLQRGRLTVREGKGKKRRVVGLDPGALEEIKAWLSMRASKISNSPYVFCTIIHGAGRRMSTTTWQGTIKDIAKRAGIERRVHSHGLRHTCAVDLRREGIHSHLIQHQLGHSTLAMTEHYLDHLEPIELIDTMRGRSW